MLLLHSNRNTYVIMSNTFNYLPRLCDTELEIALESSGAVLVEGAKWCGKTSPASHAAKSVLFMQDPDNLPINVKMVC